MGYVEKIETGSDTFNGDKMAYQYVVPPAHVELPRAAADYLKEEEVADAGQ